MATATLNALTPAGLDLSDSLYEVIDGERVEKEPMSTKGVKLMNHLTRLISNYSIPKKLGVAYSEMLIKLPLGIDRQHRPDIIFVRSDNPRAGTIDDEDQDPVWHIVPELCIEILSPNDRYYALEDKLREYFQGGVPTVWVIDPKYQRVRVHSSAIDFTGYGMEDTVTAPKLLPGFELPLAELFASPQPT